MCVNIWRACELREYSAKMLDLRGGIYARSTPGLFALFASVWTIRAHKSRRKIASEAVGNSKTRLFRELVRARLTTILVVLDNFVNLRYFIISRNEVLHDVIFIRYCCNFVFF